MKKLFVLTGAGMSVESGLSTFRDADGLWENYPWRAWPRMRRGSTTPST